MRELAALVDQAPVLLKRWLLGFVPEPWQPLLSALLTVATIIGVFAALFGIVTVLERKGLGRIQNRYGPNRVGPFGFLQFVADGLKTLTKEDIVPRAADGLLHFLAPLVLVVPVLLAYLVIPFGRGMVPIELDAGVLFFFAVGSATELSVFIAGWSSRNKYSLLGAMRAMAQMISYELPLILSTVTVIMIAGSLSPSVIVDAQSGHTGWLADWHVFTPWGFAGFMLFLIAATAESNRSPFDLPEGESEIIAGYYIEYSGFKFALFFLGEYLGMFAMSGLGITLFLGGWTAPVSFLGWVPSYAWFMIKLLGLVALFIWLRGTLPRLRMDQLMNFAWKFLVPMTLVNVLAAALWHYLGPGWMRWALCSLMIAVPYVALGRGIQSARPGLRRTYRFAD